MAYSRSYTAADGTTRDFVLGFEYLDQSHIKVYINGVLTTDWAWLNPTTIRFNTAPSAGAIVLLKRLTSPEQRLVEYTSPSSLNEEDLNADSLQAFFLSQEANDQANAGIADDPSTGQYTAGNKRVTNVADPVNAQDAVTKAWAESAMSSQLAQAIAAKDAAVAARNTSDANALATASDRISTAADRAAVNVDKGIVAADKATVAADKATVAADRAAAAGSASTATGAASTATTARNEAVAAKDAAKVSETNSATSRAAAAADAIATAADRSAVSADKATVAADKATVAADKATVVSAKDAVAADKATIDGYKTTASNAAATATGAASTATTAKNDAVTAKTGAETARGGAETARTGAETAQAGSIAARDKAQKWADEAENTPVETGKFSAKHWAAKAAAFVAGVNLPAISASDVGKLLSVSAAGQWVLKALTKGDVGLDNVDNTSDVDKPVSSAQALALGEKANTADIANATQYRTLTASKLVGTDGVKAALANVALTISSGLIAWNLSFGINFSLTMNESATLQFPTSGIPGKSGYIRVVQDATGGRTLALGANVKTQGGSGVVLTSAPNAVDFLFYQYISSTEVLISHTKDWK